MGGAKFAIKGTLCNPWGVLKNGAECVDKFCARHCGGLQVWRLIGVGFEPMLCDINAFGDPGFVVGFDIINKARQRRSPPRAPDQATMQTN